MIRPAITPLRPLGRWMEAVRGWQLDALADLQALDDAVQQHMAHAAMPCADPLTESLYAQLEGPAAQPALPYSASVPAEPEHPGWWLLAGVLLIVLTALCIHFWRA